MFDKENAENIEKINTFLGMRHRSTPYDLTNPGDLKQAFLLTVAASMDYRRYMNGLDDIIEEFDESLEYYDTATWINMGLDLDKADKLAMDATDAVSKTYDLFGRLTERADRNCALILKTILNSPPKFQEDILGGVYSIPADELDNQIKKLFDRLDEIDPHYNMEENRDAFLSLMEETWESQ